MSQWKVLQSPEENPAGIMGFNVGMWKCLVILVALTVVCRLMSMFLLKVH